MSPTSGSSAGRIPLTADAIAERAKGLSRDAIDALAAIASCGGEADGRWLGRMLGAGSSHRLKILDVTWDRSVSITSAVFRWTRSAQLPDSLAMLLLLFLFAAVVATLILIARKPSATA